MCDHAGAKPWLKRSWRDRSHQLRTAYGVSKTGAVGFTTAALGEVRMPAAVYAEVVERGRDVFMAFYETITIEAVKKVMAAAVD